MKRAVLTQKDFSNGRILFEEERIKPINEENLFNGMIYSLLSASGQDYRKLVIITNELIAGGYTAPERFLETDERLISILKKSRFATTKITRAVRFATWYPNSPLPHLIVEDANSGRNREFYLRNWLAEEAPGIAYKCASLVMNMCGYENVVPVDMWAERFLYSRGFKLKLPDYKTVGGLKRKEFLEHEKLIIGMARRRNVPPAIYHHAIWAKFSSWNNDRE